MLQHLHIENVALIRSISLEPSSNFNVLTGETGAGKSIIIDSINFVIGGRVSKDFIKTGAEKAIVEAIFDSKEIFKGFFEENKLPYEDDSIIIYRELNTNGKGISKINGRLVNNSTLAELGCLLIDMHGQHDNQTLMKSSLHLPLLDSFTGGDLNCLISDYKIEYSKLVTLESNLLFLKKDSESRKKDVDFLRFQIEEIETANILIGEEEALEDKRALMRNWAKIFEGMSFAYSQITESTEGGISAIDLIANASMKMNQVSAFNQGISELAEKMGELVFQLQEASSEIREYIFGQEFSLEDLNQLEERLDLILSLKKKYGENLHESLDRAKREFEEIDISPEKIYELEKEVEKIKADVYLKAQVISSIRKEVAQRVEKDIVSQLNDLEIKGATFSCDFVEVEANIYGIDKMEFMFSANKGEIAKPLSKIASGGEMSRVMLAIKSILADADKIPLLIFDEIDSGISGVASQMVGQKLLSLAKSHQIICVSHHAQIAAMADKHFFVSKETSDGFTSTSIDVISGDRRIAEVGRLLSGTHNTQSSISHASELINKYL
ncbi:MAG: DNA repair protein RecN [Bacillota bacterium]